MKKLLIAIFLFTASTGIIFAEHGGLFDDRFITVINDIAWKLNSHGNIGAFTMVVDGYKLQCLRAQYRIYCTSYGCDKKDVVDLLFVHGNAEMNLKKADRIVHAGDCGYGPIVEIERFGGMFDLDASSKIESGTAYLIQRKTFGMNGTLLTEENFSFEGKEVVYYKNGKPVVRGFQDSSR